MIERHETDWVYSMANKDRNKRSARKARAEERARLEAIQAEQAANAPQKATTKTSRAAAKESKPAKQKRTGFFGRIIQWFADVRMELRRVIWPSRQELKNYSVGVIITLIVLGIVIWLIDMGLVSLLSLFAGLRG